MKRHFYFLFSLVFLVACDDGDILTVDLDFEGDLERCEDFQDSYLLYDTREDPNEALILIIAKDDMNELLFTTPTTEGTPTELEIDQTNTRFIFRSYNRAIENDELCDVVASGDLSIIEDFEADSGTVFITTTIEDDDGDGLSNEDEGLTGLPDEDGIYMDSQDSDMDGIPDYLDQDDDNDNVNTINELDDDNIDGDNNPLTTPLDTDSDGIPDYLDTDDDGDDVLTRLEDEDGDLNPINDRSDNNGVQIAHYLNALETINYGDPGVSDNNQYTRTVTTHFLVTDIDIEILRATEVDFGTLITPIPNYQPED
jgi:hypothetical protein